MIQITATTRDAYDLFHEGAQALAAASRNGLRIDVEYCKKEIKKMTGTIVENISQFQATHPGQLWQKIYGSKTNFGSDQQLRNILFNKLKYKSTEETDSGLESVDNETLSSLGDPDIHHLLTIRKLSKARDTYLEALVREQIDGFVHPFFSLHLARTFRSSSERPNFQNIPKRDKETKRIVRSAVFPRLDHQILSADFSGVEVRVGACYHQDPQMIKYIMDPTTDMHRDMAIQLFKMDKLDKSHAGEKHLRYGAKNGFVFPQFYGSYYVNCAKSLLKHAQHADLQDGTPTWVHLSDKGLLRLNKNGTIKDDTRYLNYVKEIEDDFWNRRFKVYQQWKERNYKLYQKRGYLEMFTGFRCSGIIGRNEAGNYPIQGTAFHCLLWSFIQVWKKSKEEDWDSRLTGQIHDDMLLDGNPNERKHVLRTIKKITCRELPREWPWIIVPMEIEASVSPVNGSWFESKEAKIE